MKPTHYDKISRAMESGRVPSTAAAGCSFVFMSQTAPKVKPTDSSSTTLRASAASIQIACAHVSALHTVEWVPYVALHLLAIFTW